MWALSLLAALCVCSSVAATEDDEEVVVAEQEDESEVEEDEAAEEERPSSRPSAKARRLKRVCLSDATSLRARLPAVLPPPHGEWPDTKLFKSLLTDLHSTQYYCARELSKLRALQEMKNPYEGGPTNEQAEDVPRWKKLLGVASAFPRAGKKRAESQTETDLDVAGSLLAEVHRAAARELDRQADFMRDVLPLLSRKHRLRAHVEQMLQLQGRDADLLLRVTSAIKLKELEALNQGLRREYFAGITEDEMSWQLTAVLATGVVRFVLRGADLVTLLQDLTNMPFATADAIDRKVNVFGTVGGRVVARLAVGVAVAILAVPWRAGVDEEQDRQRVLWMGLLVVMQLVCATLCGTA
eukprot:TRINITY_DN27784_c0_g1_i1.p1 TRINITY_DN27784_c0_g1~~TRINITY_DN27784_c0_g1_i1.p1  ORF type:complete len:355 (+),score=134.73 TRINITY_DN27784_c0_g1_i1:64-1128(+)